MAASNIVHLDKIKFSNNLPFVLIGGVNVIESYDFVLDVSQGFILHALDSWNLTELVIAKLNKISTVPDTE